MLTGVVTSVIFGTYMSCSGLYEATKTGTNEGLVNIVMGGSILAASGIGAAVLGKSLFYSGYKSQK